MTSRAGVLAIAIAVGCGGSAPSTEEGGAAGGAREAEPDRQECVAGEDAESGMIVPEECLRGEALAVVRVVERALELETQPRAWLALWVGGGRWTHGRTARPDACDVTAGAERFPRPSEESLEDRGARIGIEGVRVVVEGDRAIVAAGTLLIEGGGEDHYADGHRYELRRHGGAWKIVSLRTWPISWGASDTGEVMSAQWWAERRAAVEAARAQLAGATEPARADALRALRSALASAQCPQQALEVARQVTGLPEPWSTDWTARADLATRLWLDGEAREAQAAAPRAALPPPAPWAAVQLDCSTAEQIPEERADEVEPCLVEAVAHADAPADPAMRPRSVAVLRIERGQAGYHHRIAAGADGEWTLGEELAPGQGQGIDGLTFSAPELRQLEPGGDLELLLRFDSHRTVEEQPMVERGWMACMDLLTEPRCLRFRERVRWGGIPEATATVTFGPDGTVTVRRGRGRSPLITPQQARLRDLLP